MPDFDALVILGPTASGKSALALEVAKHVKSEIISLDSALVYKEMDIGTAKPTKEELSLVPHHLISIIDPKESYSAAQFRTDCISLVGKIKERGNLPIICGGTMMYYKALVEGLSSLPETDPLVREKVAKEAEVHGWPYMHAKLETVDPLLFAKLAPNDKQRISRALEVYEMTGKALSSFYEAKKDACPFSLCEFVILPDNDRKALRDGIRVRFEKMLELGLIDEVKKLKERGDLSLEMPSMRSVGYRQVWEYLDGVYDYDTMIEKAVIATARLAKHQMTWLRGGLKSENRTVLDYKDPNNLQKILNKVCNLQD